MTALQPTASYYASQDSVRGYVWRLFFTGMDSNWIETKFRWWDDTCLKGLRPMCKWNGAYGANNPLCSVPKAKWGSPPLHLPFNTCLCNQKFKRLTQCKCDQPWVCRRIRSFATFKSSLVVLWPAFNYSTCRECNISPTFLKLNITKMCWYIHWISIYLLSLFYLISTSKTPY